MTEIILGPEAVASYPNLFKATLRKDAKPEDKPKFSITTLFTHDAIKTPQYGNLVAGVLACGIEKWGKAKFEEMMREQTFDSPFLKDIASKGYDPALFAVRITSAANQEYPPNVLDNRKRDAAGKRVTITDPREIYPGVRVMVSYAPRAFGGPGTKWKAGIKLDLRNVLKMGDGERLTQAGPDGSEFADVEASPEAPAIDSAGMAALLG